MTEYRPVNRAVLLALACLLVIPAAAHLAFSEPVGEDYAAAERATTTTTETPATSSTTTSTSTTSSTTSTTSTTALAVVPATAAPAVESPSGLHPAIAAHFGTGNLGHQAQRVAQCESNLNPRALNASSGASGLFQVMPFWAADFEAVTGRPYYDGRFNADANAMFAAWLHGQSGTWSHWSCKP